MEENEFRYEATGQRYVPNEEGLTLASCINNPRQLLSKAVGMFQLDPMDEEGVVVRGMGADNDMLMEAGEVGVAEEGRDDAQVTGKKQGKE